MGRIQSNIGLTTGLDIQSTVTQLMAVSARPRDRLQVRVQGFQAQQVAVNELTALVIGVQLQATRLGNAGNVSTTTATSSKTDVLTATAISSPAPGTFSIRTLQTAQTATASSSALSSASDTLQAGDFVVRTGGFVDSSQLLDDLRGGVGISRGKISITDRSGNSSEIDLRFASSVDDVVSAINSATGIRVNAKTNGDRIVLSDLTGQTSSNLVVEEVGGGRTAADLGLTGINVGSNTATGEDISFLGNNMLLNKLRDGRGIAFQAGNDLTVTLRDGTTLEIDPNSSSAPSTVGQLVTAINAVDDDKLEARIAADGNGFELIDKTTGSGTFAATGKLADQLGFTGVSGSTGTITGTRLQNTLQGPLLSSLKGGLGVGTPGTINITNRAGTQSNISLAGSVSLRDVIDRINSGATGVTASLNRSRTGIVLQDVTGSTASNLIVANGDANETATKLGIAFNDAKNSVDSSTLGLQFVSESTELSRLNQGRGIRLGSFTITNASGATKKVTLGSSTKTVGDVLAAINNNTIDIEAKLNSSGDGFVIVDKSAGSGPFSIADDPSSNAALDLGIRGSGTSVAGPSGTQREIRASQTFKLTLNGTETLSQVIEKINGSGGPLSASLLTSGPSSVRLLFTSKASGEAGRIFADGDAIGLNVTASGTARDAVIAVGSSLETGGTLVRSSSNNFSNAISGVSISIKSVSTEPVDVTVASSNANIEKNIQLFVDQFNKVRDKIEKETTFDSQTNSTGLLFGNPEVIRIEQTMARLISQRSFRSGRVQSMEQLGVSLDDKGKLKFDKDKLNRLLQSNPDDVKDFLTKEKTGFGDRSKQALEALVGERNGLLVNRNLSLQRQIDLNNRRIESMTVRLDRDRERLLKQFYDMETNIARIRNNGSGLSQLSALSSINSQQQ
ncbi:MAG: flagellar filament capping protein FliD [Pirellula sp.]